MTIDVKEAALFRFLEKKNRIYYGKALELREAVEGWLAYIPQTFPHYTRHTVKHSDAIVRELSKLLFQDGEVDEPTIPRLSGVEAYILIAAAYFHDIGMVVSDQGKLELLDSAGWIAWTSGDAGGAKRWAAIAAYRGDRSGDARADLVADIQTRHLIAEFIRRSHHVRAGELLDEHQSSLGRFAFDDLMLQRTIRDVCVAHGLRQHELQDRERYPDRRDIRGEPTNVWLLALLLRIGDLLDMDEDRACPLLLNAACPLPPESLAHWSQYRRIIHRLTAPDRIELTAECMTQEEHRFLRDWCQWLVDELKEARIAVTNMGRHSGWTPPIAILEGPTPTIEIRPHRSATYFPSRWTFELDQDAVLQRLIADAYEGPHAFVRELIQNSADATRCRMYADMKARGEPIPDFPTDIPTSVRGGYPIRITLRTVDRRNELSGELEKRQVLSIDDPGIGMDREVVERFFLQVGRSFYATEQFRRDYGFVPTSRFGVGFLSVFSDSDEVVVETFKPTSQSGASALRLKLTAPRSYLLTEKGTRTKPGTRIDVVLRASFAAGQVGSLIENWCKRLEFPIEVDDHGSIQTIEAESPSELVYDRPDITNPSASFAVRAFPFRQAGIEGEIYIFAYVLNGEDLWGYWRWATTVYPQNHPLAIAPQMATDLTCYHGIALRRVGVSRANAGISSRTDCRGARFTPTLSRAGLRGPALDTVGHVLVEQLDRILAAHIESSARAKSSDGWKYLHVLAGAGGTPNFWRTVPGSVPLRTAVGLAPVSLEETTAAECLRVLVAPEQDTKTELTVVNEWTNDCRIVLSTDLQAFSNLHRSAVFADRAPVNVSRLARGVYACDWRLGAGTPVFGARDRRIWLLPLHEDRVIGCHFHSVLFDYDRLAVMNTDHQFTQWLVRLSAATNRGVPGITQRQFEKLLGLLHEPVRFNGHAMERLQLFLAGWQATLASEPDLVCPTESLTRDAFRLHPIERV